MRRLFIPSSRPSFPSTDRPASPRLLKPVVAAAAGAVCVGLLTQIHGSVPTPSADATPAAVLASHRTNLSYTFVAAVPPAGDPFADNSPAPAGPTDLSATEVRYDPGADTVQIHVSDADLVDVLRMLSLQSQKNIIASKEVRGTVTCNLYDVTIGEALEAILRANGFVAREEGNFIYVYTREELRKIDEQNRRQETRVFRVYHTPPTTVARMIEPSLSESAVISFSDDPEIGIAPSKDRAGGYSFTGGDVLVVRDFPEHLAEVERLLLEIDRRPEQVLIEATILSTKLNENNALGVDFNVVGGVNFAAINTANGQITGAGLDSGPRDTSQRQVGVGTGNAFTGAIPGGLKVGFVANDVSAFVAALEGVTDTTVLANPKVLALNKQRGEVLVGRQDGYITTVTTDTVSSQKVEFLETGTKLIFRPYISRDGYVRLEIHPEDSQGGLNASNLPFKNTTEVTSNVMVKDGHTIVIGGLFRESSTTNRSQVPVLGNLPLIGTAFRRQADATEREEIIIMLTPHIVKDHERYAKLSAEELRRAEKIRVGTRKGMMPTGRERLSQVYYEKAVRELAKDRPNTRMANFNLNCAINLNPTFIEAIELREKLRGRVVVEADQSTIRSFVRRSALEDVVPTPPPDGGFDRPDRDPAVPAPQDLLFPPLPPAPRPQPDESPRSLPLGPGRDPEPAEPQGEPVRQDVPTKPATTRPVEVVDKPTPKRPVASGADDPGLPMWQYGSGDHP